jgi:hypothetical protein
MSLIHDTLNDTYFLSLKPYLYHLEEQEILKLPVNHFEKIGETNIQNSLWLEFYENILLLNKINEKLQFLKKKKKINFNK